MSWLIAREAGCIGAHVVATTTAHDVLALDILASDDPAAPDGAVSTPSLEPAGRLAVDR